MALGQGAGQERGQIHSCPWIWIWIWIWRRLSRVSSSCQVARLVEPPPAVGQNTIQLGPHSILHQLSQVSCTNSARCPVPAQPGVLPGVQPGVLMVGLTSFTCVFYIHGATSFWGLPVPLGGRRLPLQELVFFRPLTLALAPLVLQGLLPRHNQNPLMKGTVLRRDPRWG